VTCADSQLPDGGGGYDYSKICYLSSTITPATLPTLSFLLDPAGGMLYIPLEDLLLPPLPSQALRRLCMERMLEDGPFFISFGTRSLRNLFSVFAMSTLQVGMANKAITSPLNVRCAERLQCQGMQTRDEPLNVCVDPPCSSYYFFEFDDTAKTCVLSAGFHTTCIVIISVFLFMEVFLQEVHSKLSTQVLAND